MKIIDIRIRKTYLFPICLGLLMLSCQPNNKNINSQVYSDTAYQDNTDINDSLSGELFEDDSIGETNYLFPSPDELLDEILSTKMEVDLKLINPSANANKYIENKQLALNLGIYLSDLAYVNLSGDKNMALIYLKTIRDMAQKINIYKLIDEDMYVRIQNNMANKDSLNQIFKLMYNDMGELLESSQRNNVFALVASGALIESLYISSMSVKSYEEYKPIAVKIFEQKYLISNFYDFASQYKKDPNVLEVMQILDNFKNILESAGTNTSETKVVDKSKKHFIIRGGEDIIITKTNFEKFREQVIKVRQEIVNSNN